MTCAYTVTGKCMSNTTWWQGLAEAYMLVTTSQAVRSSGIDHASGKRISETAHVTKSTAFLSCVQLTVWTR